MYMMSRLLLIIEIFWKIYSSIVQLIEPKVYTKHICTEHILNYEVKTNRIVTNRFLILQEFSVILHTAPPSLLCGV